MPVKIFYKNAINYLRSRLSRAQMIMLIATLVGFVSGLVAVLLKTLVHYLQHWIQKIPVNFLGYLLFPAIGLLITVFIIRYFFAGHIEKGIAMVLKSIAV